MRRSDDQSNRAAIHVDLIGVPAHFLIHCGSLCGECFVDFHQIDLLRSPTGFVQCLARRRYTSIPMIAGSIAALAKEVIVAKVASIPTLRFIRAHDHHCRRTIVDARCVACRDRSGFIKSGRNALKLSALVLRLMYSSVSATQRIAFALWNQNRDDFIFECTCILRRNGFLLRRQCKGALRLTADDVFFATFSAVMPMW